MANTFLWMRTDAGEALVALDDISAIHWTNNEREVQTKADVLLKNGVMYKVYDVPMQPVIQGLGSAKVGIVPLQYVAAPPEGEN